MASSGSSGSGGGRIGGGNSPPRPPFFRSEEERVRWVRSEGVRKRSARRCTNWGLTPPGKLARYASGGEGSSSGGACRPLPPIYDSSSEEEDAPPALCLTSGDYVDNDDEEEAAIQQLAVISEAEVCLRFRREEADALRQIRAYEAAQAEARVRRVKQEVVDLHAELDAAFRRSG